jgi:hypothetical protein
MSDNLIVLMDFKKKKFKTHVLESATVFSPEKENRELMLEKCESPGQIWYNVYDGGEYTTPIAESENAS